MAGLQSFSGFKTIKQTALKMSIWSRQMEFFQFILIYNGLVSDYVYLQSCEKLI